MKALLIDALRSLRARAGATAVHTPRNWHANEGGGAVT